MPKNWFQPREIVPRNASDVEKKLSKIFLRIEKLALKGKGNFLEYHKLVDEMIDKGSHQLFEQAIYHYYGIDCIDYQDVKQMKEKSWMEILFQTESPFLIKLKRLLDKNEVYQLSYDIYLNNNTLIGKIIEREVFTPDANYYLQNAEFARIMGAKKTYLEVFKVGSETPEIFAFDDLSKTEDQNLLKRYEMAINFLKS
jgi:hypothetical protein